MTPAPTPEQRLRTRKERGSRGVGALTVSAAAATVGRQQQQHYHVEELDPGGLRRERRRNNGNNNRCSFHIDDDVLVLPFRSGGKEDRLTCPTRKQRKKGKRECTRLRKCCSRQPMPEKATTVNKDYTCEPNAAKLPPKGTEPNWNNGYTLGKLVPISSTECGRKLKLCCFRVCLLRPIDN